MRTVRLAGRASVSWLWDTVLTLLKRRVAADIKATLASHRIDEKKVSVFLAVPVLEAWILAGTDEQPEVPDAKQRLRKLLGRRSPDELADAVKSLDLEKARRRSPSLDAFVAGLESLRPSAA